MTDLFAAFAAPGLEPGTIWVLLGVSFASSALTAALSLGGGMLMLAVLTLYWPAAVVVPVHGFIQLGSNAGRALLRRAFIQWQFAGWFILGSALGALAGGRVATVLPDTVFKALIALFILWSVWAPRPKLRSRGPAVTALAGAVTSAVGMVVGIAGPLVVAFLGHLEDRRQIIATQAFLMTCQNAFKVISFMLFGFAFGAYLPLIVLMIAAGLAGTAAGSLLLDHLSERFFRIAFRVVLTVIALDLLRRVALEAI
jgi:uncharacterized protein